MKSTRLAIVALLTLSLAACGEDEPTAPQAESSSDEERMAFDDGMMEDEMSDEMSGEEAMMAAAELDKPVRESRKPPVAQATDYQVALLEDVSADDEDARRLRVWILAPRAESAAARAQTVLRAAMEVLDEDAADRVEVHLLPDESEVLAGTEFTLAEGTYAIDARNLANGSWEVRSTGNTIPELNLVAVELYAENTARFQRNASGKVKEKALMSYIARILATSPKAVKRTMEEARKVVASKKPYSDR